MVEIEGKIVSDINGFPPKFGIVQKQRSRVAPDHALCHLARAVENEQHLNSDQHHATVGQPQMPMLS